MFEQEIYDQIENKLFLKASLAKIPLRGDFEITPRCSMACKMCYIVMTPEQIRSAGKHELTAAQWLKLGEEACKSGMLSVLLTGGEAMIRSDFKEIFSGLSSMGLTVDLNTNGTLFTPDMLDWMAVNPPSQVNLTLYGSNNESYERLCGLPDGFDRVSKAIDDMQAMGINVRINSTLTPYNYMDADQIIAYANERKIPIKLVSYNFLPKRRDGDDAYIERLDAKTAGELELKLKSEPWSAPGDLYLKKLLEQIERKERSSNPQPMEISCRAGRSTFWITWEGVMLPCCTLDNITAYPLRDGFDAAWKSIYERTEKIFFPEKCWGCDKKPFCPGCPAIYYCETGDSNKHSDYLCAFADSLIAAAKAKYNGD
ncbi:MAG: radical SAM protein [Clostridia bacterium]|nr:radical SAM protein [Clostridia bacterium]